MFFNINILALIASVVFVVAEEDISKEAHCAGCQATVKALVLRTMHQSKVAPKKNVSWKLREAMKGICKPELFDSHEFSSQKLVASCKKLLEDHKPALEKLIKKNFKSSQAPPAAGVANDFCFQNSGLCAGLEQKYIREHAQRKPDSFDTDELIKLHGDKVRQVMPQKEEL